MSFELNDTEISIVNSAKNISEKFDDDYWLDCDLNSKFPQEFYEEVASGGWLGMCMPEKLVNKFGKLYGNLLVFLYLCHSLTITPFALILLSYKYFWSSSNCNSRHPKTKRNLVTSSYYGKRKDLFWSN